MFNPLLETAIVSPHLQLKLVALRGYKIQLKRCLVMIWFAIILACFAINFRGLSHFHGPLEENATWISHPYAYDTLYEDAMWSLRNATYPWRQRIAHPPPRIYYMFAVASWATVLVYSITGYSRSNLKRPCMRTLATCIFTFQVIVFFAVSAQGWYVCQINRAVLLLQFIIGWWCKILNDYMRKTMIAHWIRHNDAFKNK